MLVFTACGLASRLLDIDIPPGHESRTVHSDINCLAPVPATEGPPASLSPPDVPSQVRSSMAPQYELLCCTLSSRSLLPVCTRRRRCPAWCSGAHPSSWRSSSGWQEATFCRQGAALMGAVPRYPRHPRSNLPEEKLLGLSAFGFLYVALCGSVDGARGTFGGWGPAHPEPAGVVAPRLFGSQQRLLTPNANRIRLSPFCTNRDYACQESRI